MDPKKELVAAGKDNSYGTSCDESTNPASIPVSMLPDFVELVRSDDDGKRLHGAMMIRLLLSVERDPPFDEVVQSGVCPLLVAFLARSDFPELQFEATWALTNVAAGRQGHTSYVMGLDATPQFVALLSSPSEHCREQAALAIGNVAADNVKSRDYVLELGAFDSLLRMITSPVDPIKLSALRTAVWALSNLCRGKPPAELEKVAISLPVLSQVLRHEDEEVASDALWAISYITDGPNRVQPILECPGVLDAVVQRLDARAATLLIPAIRTIKNLTCGNDMQTQAVICAGALPALRPLFSHHKTPVRREACCALANIAAGTPEQIQAIIDAKLFPEIFKMMSGENYDIKKTAVRVVANATCGGTADQIRWLVKAGALEALVAMLSMRDTKELLYALDAVTNILKLGEEDAKKKENGLGHNLFVAMLCDDGGLDKIEQLQRHSAVEVFDKVTFIFRTFFEPEEEAALQTLASLAVAQAPQMPPDDSLPNSEVSRMKRKWDGV